MTHMIELPLESAQATEDLGARLARFVTPGCVLYLRGELGAGKTTLVRGLLRALGHEGSVKSPTFTLVEPYEIDDKRIFHLDLYRLAGAEELEFIGIRDFLAENSIIVVEWPERGQGALPAADLDVAIAYAGEGRLCRIDFLSARAEACLDGLKPQ